jgi:hypothetical protein
VGKQALQEIVEAGPGFHCLGGDTGGEPLLQQKMPVLMSTL